MSNDTDQQAPMPVTVSVHRPEVKTVRELTSGTVNVSLGRLDDRVDVNFVELMLASPDALAKFVMSLVNAAEREFPGFAKAIATDLQENMDRALIRPDPGVVASGRGLLGPDRLGGVDPAAAVREQRDGA